MAIRDAAEIIEQDVLPAINTMTTTFNKVAEIHLTRASDSSATGSNQSNQQNGQQNAKDNAQLISDFTTNVVAPALQQALGNKATPSAPRMGMGQSSSSGHRQGQQ